MDDEELMALADNYRCLGLLVPRSVESELFTRGWCLAPFFLIDEDFDD